MFDGTGTATWEDGTTYTGEWRNDQPNGTGEMTVPPAAGGGGSRGSLPSTLDFSNRDEVGFHYKGSMVDGEYTPTHGFDHPAVAHTMLWPGEMHGEGVGTWDDGWLWQGSWRHNAQQGDGMLTDPTGAVRGVLFAAVVW